MKNCLKQKLFFLTLSFIFFVKNISSAQNFTLSVFSEKSERFWVVINGEKKNDKAAANVKVTDLTGSYWKMKIMFENEELPEITQNVYRPFDASQTTYQIKKNRKGNYVLRMYSASDFGFDNPTTNNRNNHRNNNGNGNNNRNNGNNNNNNNNNNGVNININLGGVGNNNPIKNNGSWNNGNNNNNGNWNNGNNNNNNGNWNNNNEEDDDDTYAQNPYNTNNGNNGSWNNGNNNNNGNNGNWNNGNNNGSWNNGNNNNNGSWNNENNNGNWNNGNNGTWSNGKCQMPMSSNDFDVAFQNIEKQRMENTKMTVAKQITDRNCMSVQQIRKIISIFDFESYKLDYAKYAYDHCYDKQNYYLLNDVFDYSTSINELDKFLQSKK